MSANEIAQRGLEIATAELVKKGASVEPHSEGRSRNFLQVRPPHGRANVVYVKTRRVGDWQTDYRKGTPRETLPEDEGRFWLFVDLTATPPAFYVAPESWVENDIYEKHVAAFAKHGGTRPHSPKSTHHAIVNDSIAEWRDRWDLLGLADD